MQIPFWQMPGLSRHSFISTERRVITVVCFKSIFKRHLFFIIKGLGQCCTFTSIAKSRQGSMAVGTQTVKSSWKHTIKRSVSLFCKCYCVRVLIKRCVCLVLHTIPLSWAQLTGKSPALSRHLAAAAFGLGGVEGFGDRALACLEFGETEALSGI